MNVWPVLRHAFARASVALLALIVPAASFRGSLFAAQPGSLDGDFACSLPRTLVGAITAMADGAVLVGGQNMGTGPGDCHGLMVRLYHDGNLDWTFYAAAGEPLASNHCASVSAIAIQADGRILVGGDFDHYNKIPRSRVARLHPDGSLDLSFDPGLGAISRVLALALQSNGRVLVGGNLSTAPDQTAKTNLVRLNPDGSLDASFATTLAPALVGQVLVQSDDRVLLISNNSLLRLNPDGTVDNTFHVELAGWVYRIALQPDGKIIVGSVRGVSWLPGSPAAMTLRLNPDGSLDPSFFPILWDGQDMRYTDSIALLTDGKILMGGAFRPLPAMPESRVIRLNPDGTVDGNFTAAVPFRDTSATALAADKDGNAYLAGGGGFLVNTNCHLLRLLGGEPAPTPPEIKVQPVQTTFGQGTNVLLSSLVAGSPPPVCQWQVDGKDLPTATHSGLLLTNLAAAPPGTYRLRVSNALGSVLSDPVILTPPVIMAQPEPQVVRSLGTAQFSVVVTNSLPLTYQWQVAGLNLTGETNSSLVLTDVQPANAGNYTVVISNSMGSSTSVPAALIVLPATPPTIVLQPQSQSLKEGEAALFSVSATHYLPMTYQWQFESQVLSGATNTTLVLTNLHRIQAGAYTVVVSSSSGSTTSDPATLTVLPATPPAIVVQPASQVVPEGGVVSFSVTATNYLPLRYQWQLNTTNIYGATLPTLTVWNVHLSQAGAYQVVVSSEFTATTSDPALLSVTPLPFDELIVTNANQASLEATMSNTKYVTFGVDGVITITNTLLITRDMTLDATGRTISMNGQTLLRHFVVTNTATLRLMSLTLVNGQHRAADGEPNQPGNPGLGGSIYNSGGTLELIDCKFMSNVVVAGNGGPTIAGGPSIGLATDGGPAYGGAIYSIGGWVSATNCLFDSNGCTGGQGVMSQDSFSGGGGNAFGGAVYCSTGGVALVGVTFTNNLARAGEMSRGSRQGAGGAGYGGALADVATTVLISNCVFGANQAFGATRIESHQDQSGSANGGAVFHESGSMNVGRSLFTNNVATGGGANGPSGQTFVSGPGNGGAVFNGSGSLELQNSAFIMNQANGGPGSAVVWVSYAGTGAGGAVYNLGGLTLINCTLAANSANGGAGVRSIGSAQGGSAYGGVLFSGGGGASLVNVTVASNSVQVGYLPRSSYALGSSIFTTTNATVTLTNTILFGPPSQTNVSGTIIDGGHNISSDQSANFTKPSSRMNLDPLLAPLAYNGGSTPTMALLPASPAIDAGDDTAAPGTDQRGVTRPKSRASDIGAYELAPGLRMTNVAGGKSQVDYVFLAGETNLASASTNLSGWSSLGLKVADTNGVTRLEEVDQSQFPDRFYKLESLLGR